MYSNTAAVARNDIKSFLRQAPKARQMLIGDKLAPFHPVSEPHGRYPVFEIAGAQILNAPNPASDATLRRPDGGYNRVKRRHTYDTYDVESRGLEELVDDVDRAQANGRYGFDLEVVTADFLTLNMLLGHERRVAAAVTAISGTSATANLDISDPSVGKPVTDVLNAIGRMNAKGYLPNTLVMSFAVMNQFKVQTEFLNYGKRVGIARDEAAQAITMSDIVAAFAEHGITQLLVGRNAYRATNPDGAATNTNLWTDDFIAVADIEGGEPEAGGFARTLYWDETGSGEYAPETYRDEQRRSDVIRVRLEDSIKVIDTNAFEKITISIVP